MMVQEPGAPEGGGPMSDTPTPADVLDRIAEALAPLPPKCPTCGSGEPNTYYGSCFDNQHSSIFDPRLPLDPWHEYVRTIVRLTKAVDSLEFQREVTLGLLAERDAALARVVQVPNGLPERLRQVGDKSTNAHDVLILGRMQPEPFRTQMMALARDMVEAQLACRRAAAALLGGEGDR